MEQIVLLALTAAKQYLEKNRTPVVKNNYVICDDPDFKGFFLDQPDFHNGKKYGVYVSFYKKNVLRARSGFWQPSKRTLGDEVIFQSIAACTKCTDFPPVLKEELSELEARVDLLEEKIEIKNPEEQSSDLKNKTLLASRNFRSGICLPQETSGTQEALCLALSRADIGTDEQYDLFGLATRTFYGSL